MENPNQSSIFTREWVDQQLEIERSKFYEAVRKKAARQLEGAGWEIHLPSDAVMSPAVAWVAFRGVPEGVTEAEFLRTLQAPVDRYASEADRWWAERAVAAQGEEIAADMGEPVMLHAREASEQARHEIERGLKLLEQAWPEVARQIERLVHKIVFVGGTTTHFHSGTCVYAFGAVFLNPTERWNAVNFVDSLLHESGHLTLMIKQSFGRMLENWDQKAKSPLRKDMRWLNGILHAAYVLSCICTGLRRLETTPGLVLTADEQATVRQLFGKYETDFQEALQTLEDEGVFTPAGRQFLDELQAVRHDLSLHREGEVI